MRSTCDSVFSWVLVLVAASSLFSMVGLLQIDKIVHQDLYRYGLQFSYQWAMPYWTMTRVAFATGWFNIIAAIVFQLYVLTYKRKETKRLETEVEKAEKEILKTEILEKIQAIKDEKEETEIKPIEKIEEQKEQETKPAETVEEQLKETPVSVIETETEEKKEETQTVIEEAPSQGQTESQQSEEPEEQKEQEPEPLEESETEQKQTKSESQKKSEETPIIVGVPEEELLPAIEETQQ